MVVKNELVKSEGVKVVAVPHPFKVQRVDMVVADNNSLGDILALAQPDTVLRRHAHIVLNDKIIPRSEWEAVYPKMNDIVTIRVVPMGGGGGGKNPLRTILTVAIIAAAFIAPYAINAYLGTLGTVGGMTSASGFALTAFGTAVVKGAVMGIGMLAMNALAPPKTPSAPSMGMLSGTSGLRDSPTLFIEGAKNRPNPFGIVPVVLGVHKSVPPLGAGTYTEIVGDDQHLRMLLVFGYGRLKIEDIKIGNTPIGEFDDIEYEVMEGVSGDPDITIFPDTVGQEDFSALLKQEDDWTTRTSGIDADELIVDVVFPRGLVNFNDKGDRENRTVNLEMQYRETDTAGDWLNPNLSVSNSRVNTVTTLVESGYLTTGMREEKKGGSGRSANNMVWREYIYTAYSKVHDAITDTDSTQVITSGLNALPEPSTIRATSGGLVSDIDAVQVIVEGTDTDDVFQTETLPAFTAGSSTSVTGSKTFKTITKITAPSHSGGILELTMTDNSSSAVRYGYQWKTPSRGQYDIRLRRTTADTDSTRIFDLMHWSATKTVTDEEPIDFPFPLAKMALKVRATNQLSGIIDNLSAKVSSYVLDWNGSTWAEGVSSNPASIFRHVLQSDAMASPLADSRIDLSSLQTWHTHCASEGYEFNMVRDFQSSVWELLSDISIAGRATPVQIDGKWGVAIDKEQTIPVQHFTPRNSSNFEAEKDFVDVPHALRMRFANKDTDYKQDERIVYDDGYDVGSATVFEQLDSIGMTDADHIWKHGRFNLAQMRLRPERWTLNVDFEYLVARRGDLVLVTHDVLLVGLKAGRITAVQVDGSGDCTGVTVDETLTMESGKSYGLSIRTRDNAGLTRGITLDVGDQTTVVFDSVIDSADIPVVGDVFGFGLADSETIKGLLLTVEPLGDLQARLTIVPYSDGIYSADTGSLPDFESKLTPQALIPEVTILETRTDESVLKLGAGNTLIPRIAISYGTINQFPDAVVEAQIRVTGSEQDFKPVVLSSQTDSEIIIEDVENRGTYDIRLHWVDKESINTGEWSYSNAIYVIGQTSTPSPLSNLNINTFGASVLLRWDALEDLDVRFGGSVKFRHSKETMVDDASWGESVGIGEASKGTDLSALLPLKVGTYLAKVFDKGQRASTVVKVSTKQNSVLSFANVDTVTESTTYTGTHTNTIAVDSILKLASAGLFDDITSLDTVSSVDYYGGSESSGVYDFATGFDFGSVEKVRITTDIGVTVFNPLDNLDDRASNIDVWEDFDGTDSTSCDARVQERHTDDDTSGTPTWSEWQNLESAEFEARGFDFRVNLTSDDNAFNIKVDTLIIEAEEVV